MQERREMERANAEEEDVASLRAAHLTAVLIGAVFVFIGVPVWWKTTEVYRAPLSHSEIAALTTTPLTTRVSLEVVGLVPEDRIESSTLALFGQRLKEIMEASNDKTKALNIEYRGQVRRGSVFELATASRVTDEASLDVLFAEAGSNDVGRLHVYLVSNSVFALSRPYLGRRRSAFLPIQDEKDLMPLVADVDAFIRGVLVNEPAVFHAFQNARGSTRLSPDKESMRALKSAPEYQLTFTLMDPRPSEKRPIVWDVAGAVDDHLQPLVDRLAPYVQLYVDSQVLYYVSLPMRPHHDAKNGRWYLTPSDLPHIVNPVEAKLVSHVSSRPIVHFLVYVPPPEHSPLFIYDAEGEPSPSNAFVSARWGGMIIVNPDRGDSGKENAGRPIQLDSIPIMETFLSQLRSLLHFDTRAVPEAAPELVVAEPDETIVAGWELDAWLRRRTLENVATSGATLKSLSDLLEKIHNIVINDDIGADVESALRSCQRAGNALKEGRLAEAYVESRSALVASEKAFFDPSLLELLYFPDDQKFAIYMPLFLPIGLPIVSSLVAAYRWTKRRKEERLAKKQS